MVGLRRGTMYIPDGVDDRAMTSRRYYRMQKRDARFCAIFCNAYSLKNGIWGWPVLCKFLATNYEVHEMRKGLERAHRVWIRVQINQ